VIYVYVISLARIVTSLCNWSYCRAFAPLPIVYEINTKINCVRVRRRFLAPLGYATSNARKDKSEEKRKRKREGEEGRVRERERERATHRNLAGIPIDVTRICVHI